MVDLGNSNSDLIEAHIKKHIGEIDSVFHEIESEHVHIDTFVVPPTPEDPYYKLITSGMSSKPMNLPYDIDEDSEQYLELMITLPSHWKFDDLENENWYWPIRLLKKLARFPHQYNTYLGYGHTMQNGADYEPYASNTKLSGSILLPLFGEGSEGLKLKVDDKKTIYFYSVLPLYKEEVEFALNNGKNAFFRKLIENDFNLELIPDRPMYKL